MSTFTGVSTYSMSKSDICDRQAGHLLARIALPPDSRDADMRSILHHITVGNTGAIEHSLVSEAMLVSLVSRVRVYLGSGIFNN